MSSLYIHIPFCHHKCIYCAFYSVAQKVDKDFYVDCLVKELQKRKDFIANSLQTIYFGGGTPSLLSIRQTEKILENIEKIYNIYNVEETTFEINAENADEDYLKSLKSLGINRLSIGIESFDDEDLRFLNRSHNSFQAKAAIENAFKAGFDNISVDLISNLPFSSFEKWKKNLQTAVNYDIKHISCYTLMIEEGTMLEKMIQKGKYSLISEKRALEEFDFTMEFLDKYDFQHYETSSYAKDGYQSKHNMAYWTFQSYLGLGAAAHSYNGRVRMWNESDVLSYMQRIANDNFMEYPKQETLSLSDCYEEYIMLSARMNKGLNKQYVKDNFPTFFEDFERKCEKMISQNYLNTDLSLTQKGWHLQDTLILNLV